MLAEKGYVVYVFLFNIHNHLSEECAKNRDRIIGEGLVRKFTEITANFEPPQLTEKTLVVDGLFGSGLKEPLTGGFASLVKYINQSPSQVVSIDIPSGLMTESNRPQEEPAVVKANVTLTLHIKKLAMFFADCQQYLGEVRTLDIRLSKYFIDTFPSLYDTIESSYIKSLMLKRDDFAHKGSMGNALLIAGSRGMAGAAILASKACMRSGAGKVTALTPQCNLNIMQMAVPEAICLVDRENYYSEAIDTDCYQAVGIGPGLGKEESTALALMSQLQQTNCPVVLDADALNMLGAHGSWVQQLPNNMIMTPHPREFDRLAGRRITSDYDRLTFARDMARDLRNFQFQ
jgi:NAD(P)H-hydrate epimerase